MPRDEGLIEYRRVIEERYAEVCAEYDRTVLLLAGGGLGVSFAFVKDVVPGPSPDTIPLLVASWSALGVALASVLLAMLFGQLALRKALRQVDAGAIRSSSPGGWQAYATNCLNFAAAGSLVAGIILLAFFAASNLRSESMASQGGSGGGSKERPPVVQPQQPARPSVPRREKTETYVPPPPPPEPPKKK